MKRKIELVPDWRKAWRWVSVNCMVLAGTVQVTWASLPDDMRASIPQWALAGLTVAILVIGVLGRLTQQK